MKLKIKAVAVDGSGNEQEVWAHLSVSFLESFKKDNRSMVRCELENDIGTFAVEAIPGKFNPWGRTEPSLDKEESNG